MNDEILTVHRYSWDDDAWVVKCPHCGRMMGVEDGPIRGEQYQDLACGGWFEVDSAAVAVKKL